MTEEPEPPKPKSKLPLIVGTALATTAIASAAFFGGYYGISRIPDGQTQTTPSEVDLKIKGNRNSKIYHLPGCPNYDDIAVRNIVWFKTHEAAKSGGYRMAKNC